MNQKIWLLFAFVLGFVASELSQNFRNSNAESSQTISKSVENQQIELKNASTSNSENFDEFLQNFNSDSSFQISRIIFPLKKEALSQDFLEEVSFSIQKKHWRFLPILGSADFFIQISNPDEKGVEKSNRKLLELNGIENGLYISYEFQLVDNQWFLVSWIDRST